MMRRAHNTITPPTAPTVLVLFGITGDLVRKKILKGIYSLYLDGLLPKQFHIIGVAHSQHTTESAREYLHGVLAENEAPKPEQYAQFLECVQYMQADFAENDVYECLGEILGQKDGEWNACANKLYYLSVSPKFYNTIIDKLNDHNLADTCSDEEGWTRVILEKPFGRDLFSAKALDQKLTQVFKEEQVYRVDHYLAKETVRNILAFRFSNQLLAPVWNSESIDHIEIRMSETVDVTDRGAFYDGVGALRDVGQNHLLQLLSVIIMDNPIEFTAEHIRRKRADALRNLPTLLEEDVPKHTTRGQYEDYQQTEGVDEGSQTETAFSLEFTVQDGAMKGVPVRIQSGKALAKAEVDITLTLKHPTACFCTPEQHQHNTIRYEIQPDERIDMQIMVKQPGHEFVLEEQTFSFSYHEHCASCRDDEDIAPYEQLFYEILMGDQTLFVSTEEVMEQWRIVEPIIDAWAHGNPALETYKKGTTLEEL